MACVTPILGRQGQMHFYDSLAGQPNILGQSRASERPPPLKRKENTKNKQVDDGVTDAERKMLSSDFHMHMCIRTSAAIEPRVCIHTYVHVYVCACVHGKKERKDKKQRQLAFLAHILKFYLKI